MLLLADFHLDVLAVEEAPVGPMHRRVCLQRKQSSVQSAGESPASSVRKQPTNALQLVDGVVLPLTRPAAEPHETAPGAPVLRVGGVAVRARPLDARGPGGRAGPPGGLEGGQARGGTAGRVRAPDRRRGSRAPRWKRLVALLAVVAAFVGAFGVFRSKMQHVSSGGEHLSAGFGGWIDGRSLELTFRRRRRRRSPPHRATACRWDGG